MEIVLIGTGNAASILGRKLKEAGNDIVQVYGRNSAAASRLAYDLGTESVNYINIIKQNADLYILAVSDMAIRPLAADLQLGSKLVVHTAASVSREVLRVSSAHYGVFYPLQTLRKESAYIPDIPVIIDAGDEDSIYRLERLARSISNYVVKADDEARRKLHLAAVFCNNFVNHLYVLTENYCKKEGLDFGLFLPLIRETAARLHYLSPSLSQTGPALREDHATIEAHLAMLEKEPQLKEIYRLFTENINRTR